MTVCFTGHRQLPAMDTPAFTRLVAAVDLAIEQAIRDGATVFLTGGAAGFDTLCAERVLLQRQSNAAILLFVYLPYRGFGMGFAASDRRRAQAVLAKADRTVILSETAQDACYACRNQRLVDDADAVIAFLREKRSGTGQTVRMAREKGIPITFLPVES